MGLFDMFRRAKNSGNATKNGESGIHASASQSFSSLNDPALYEFMRNGGGSPSAESALSDSTIFRATQLLSASVGMLPCNVMKAGSDKSIEKASDHPLHILLTEAPNTWQTPFAFKQLMEFRLLHKGNAYALVLWRGARIIGFIPLDPDRVTVKQRADWSLAYRYTRPDGVVVEYEQKEILHLSGLSIDGLTGVSRVRLAQQSIRLALASRMAATRMMEEGVNATGALTHPAKMSKEAHERLKASVNKDHSGPENAGKWMILEEGMTAAQFRTTMADLQGADMRKMQIEEHARFFGIPRPLLMMDDTSWGSGIEQLAIFYVQYGLAPEFVAWEEALNRVCLTRAERLAGYFVKFNAHALLRGSLKDQAEFFAKASGAGGHRPWMMQNEIREKLDMNPVAGGDTLEPLFAQARPAGGNNAN